MSKPKYIQCLLRKNNVSEVAYIPLKYAEKDAAIRLRCEDGSWESGWIVDQIYGTAVDEPPDIHKAIRKHRQNTGDSLPK